MGRHLRQCDLPNSRYAYTILHGVTSDKKQICTVNMFEGVSLKVVKVTLLC